MIRRLPVVAVTLICGVFFMILPDTSRGQCPDVVEDCNFKIYTPKFASPDHGSIGENVALALQHQVFRTFLVSIPAGYQANLESGPEDICCFLKDTIAVLDDLLPDLTKDAARQLGVERSAELVLWGQAWPWGEYVVVQPYLSVIGPPAGLTPGVRVCCTNIPEGLTRQRPFTRTGEWRIWQITAEDRDGKSNSLSINRFPRDFYDLPQISLDAAKVSRFTDLAGLDVYDRIGGTVIPGVKTTATIEAEQHVRDWTYIKNPRGWIQLPEVDAGTIVNFVGGIFYFMRGNWERAQASFELVARDEAAVSSVRMDASLLLAATLSRRGTNCVGCDEAIAFAKSINPYSQVVARYELMAELANAVSEEDYQRIGERVASEKHLFPENDQFTQSARAFLAALAPQIGVPVADLVD